MSNPIYDFTFRNTKNDIDCSVYISWLKKYCKSWEFQEETSENGYCHYQGKFSLVKKRRKQEIINILFPHSLHGIELKAFEYIEPLAKDTKYFLKEDTRTGGPWTSEDTEVYVPRQYRGKLEILYPFQKTIWNSQFTFDDRKINLVYCPLGNKGKSTIVSLMDLHGCGLDLPPVNDYEKLMGAICDMCIDKNIRNPKTVHFDLPRATDKSKLYGLISAIESIKKGKLFDFRYKYKDWWIDSPQIWVYSNYLIDTTLLSSDRWILWTIEDNKLVPYVEPVISSLDL